MSATPSSVQRDFPPKRSTGRWAGFGLGLAAGLLLTGSYLLFEFHGYRDAGVYFAAWCGSGWDTVMQIGSKPKHTTLDQLRYRILSEGNRKHQYDRDLEAFGYPTLPAKAQYWPAPIELAILLFLFFAPSAAGWLIGIFRDSDYERKMREGVHVSGGRQIDMREYRKHNKGDGLVFLLKPRQGHRKTHLL